MNSRLNSSHPPKPPFQLSVKVREEKLGGTLVVQALCKVAGSILSEDFRLSFLHIKIYVRKQLKDLGNLLNIDLCPVFISRKVGGEDLKHQEIKPALINGQSVVYKFECGWCDASYVDYTRPHLYQRIDEHKRSGSIFNHTQSQHPSRTITSNMFHILKKCSGKFDCLLYEMFLIREHKPCLNIQSDSIKAKLFT